MDLTLPDALVGRLLDGRYEVGPRLARGGMATVHEGLDTRLGRPIALKIMHPDLAEDQGFVDRFIAEARHAARLSRHPNVVSIYDQGDSDGLVWIAMELVDGRTLRAYLRERRRLDPAEALDLLEPVLSALAAAHLSGLIHRDVKPENVLVGRDGRVQVTDFGLARAVAAQSTVTRGVLLGTVAYIAPEQALGRPATPASDVYSAGIVLFELLTGHAPHQGPTDYVIVRKHVDEDVPRPSDEVPGLPGAVDELVRRATARDPQQRLADGAEFLAALRRVRQLVAGHQAGRAAAHPLPALSHTADDAADGTPTSVLGPLARTAAPARTGRSAVATGPVRAAGAGGPGPVTGPVLPTDVATHTPHGGTGPHAGTGPLDGTGPQVGTGPHGGSGPLVGTGSLDSTGPLDGTGSHVGTGPHGGTGPHDSTGPLDGDDPAERPSRRRRWRLPVGVLAVVLLAALAGWGSWWFVDGRFVTTPALTRMAVDDASAKAASVGLLVAVDGSDYSETVPKDEVLTTEPSRGERVPSGGTVDLILSKGPERYDVPTVVGLTQEAATAALAEQHLRPGVVTQAWDDKVAAGRVVSQGTDPGERVRPDTRVDLVVSKGREPVDLADWTGQPADDAVAALKKDGLRTSIERAFSDAVPRGRVISQEPGAGDEVFKKDTIVLTVSKGPETVEIPRVEGQSVEAARRALEAVGLQARSVVLLPAGPGNVLRQSPAEGGRAKQGTTITLYVF